MNAPLLTMRAITKTYSGVQALSDGWIDVRRGETVALVGENGAGKSTLMKALLGLVQPDSGTIRFDGSEVSFRSPAQALQHRISMIHQEISLVPGLSIAENVWLGREGRFARGGFLGQSSRVEATRELLDRLGFPLDATRLVETLSIAEMQLVEIARAVSFDAALVVMDEPTSALTPSEVDLLFRTIDDLNAGGVAVIFISHKLDEVFRLAERICVMRDGRTIGMHPAEALTTDQLVGLIAGRELSAANRRGHQHTGGEVVLEVEGLSGEAFTDVTFRVHAGEVYGFCGLMGAGRTEIVSALYGLLGVRSGVVRLRGRPVAPRSPREAVAAGFGMVTEDRLRSGAIYTYSVAKNSALPFLPHLRRWRLLDRRAENRAYRTVAQQLRIKAASPDSLIGELSGGNQQKVLISRWLHQTPDVLILDEPTRGIDVGAKAEIYEVIDGLAQRGIAVLVVSSELPELLAICDRIGVIRAGRLVHEQDGATATQEVLLSHAFGVDPLSA